MHGLMRALREHWHFVIVVTVLTLVMTWPTVVYVFRTDVFWLPTGGSRDALAYVWSVSHTRQFLMGEADPFYTYSMFYPQGISLAYRPHFLLHTLTVNALQIFLPLSNAYALAQLLIVFTAASSAYIYILWLFKDKWIALFGAIVFGFSPNVISANFIPDIPWIAPIPLVMYCFHRGMRESRTKLIVIAGVLTGLTTTVALYHYACIVIMLGIWVCALAVSSWRSAAFWRHIIVLAAAIALSSVWRLAPMLQNTQDLETSMALPGLSEKYTDFVLFLVNLANPILRPLLDAIFQNLENFHTPYNMSYIGYLPLVLIGIGLSIGATRRRMLPWIGLGLVFLVLRLGSTLTVNGIEYNNIILPKFYLNQLLPPIFQAFHNSEHFMAGARLPIAVLACFGLVALQQMRRVRVRPVLIILLVVIVAVEYYKPVKNWSLSYRSFDYLDWLAAEEDSGNIALVNLPMGRRNSKFYNVYHAISGFPHAEGHVSRMRDNAYDYIRANIILNAWHNDSAVACDIDSRAQYLFALKQLESDGFSHVVLHHHIGDRAKYSAILDSFSMVEPSYAETSVSVFRLEDLRASCDL